MVILGLVLNILASLSSIAAFVTLCTRGEWFWSICAITLGAYFAFEAIRHVVEIRENK